MYIRCINVLLQSPQFDPHKLWRHLFSTYYAGQHAGCDSSDLLGNGTAHPRRSVAVFYATKNHASSLQSDVWAQGPVSILRRDLSPEM